MAERLNDPVIRFVRGGGPRRRWWCAFVVLVGASVGAGAETGTSAEAGDVLRARVRVFANEEVGQVHPEVFGINLHPSRKKQIADPKVRAHTRNMGIKSIRFPNGCVADLYDWKNAEKNKQITVDEFLEFCKRVGAEPYYTINMQGGTEGLTGPVPADASLEQRIRYRHEAPNPCRNTNYHFGTLAETIDLVLRYTVERALAGKHPLIHYEMGNENWGQAKTDWPPDVYAATVKAYATGMRDLVAKARGRHPRLKALRLHITAVGYPVMGNNQDPAKSPDRDINVAWTGKLALLHAAGVIDAVQEHFYPYSSGGGDALVWTVHNLGNIILAREGTANPRLNGYVDPELTYGMPLEFTEWNLKCWGERYKNAEVGGNLDFEHGLEAWQAADAGDGARVEVATVAARRGKGGLWLVSGSGEASWSQASRRFAPPADAPRVFASAWIRTAQPQDVRLSLTPVVEGEVQGEPAESWSRCALQADRWHKIVVGGDLPEGTRQLELSIRAQGRAVQAFVDCLEVLYWTKTSNLAPMSANKAVQQLYCVDVFRVMIEHGIQRAHFHHLMGSYPCGALDNRGRPQNNHLVFRFFKRTLRRQEPDSDGDRFAGVRLRDARRQMGHRLQCRRA